MTDLDDELPPWLGERYRDFALALQRGQDEQPEKEDHDETPGFTQD